MSIKYHKSGNSEYASYGRSVRCDGKVKTEYTYIGKVIDKAKGLYLNKKMGYVVFDADTKEVLPAPSDMIPFDPSEGELEILDFGDTFLADTYLHRDGLKDLMGSIDCKDTDTLSTLVIYYALTHRSADHLKAWYEGKFIKEVYPDAKLEVPDILKFMKDLGSEKSMKKFLGSCQEVKGHRAADPRLVMVYLDDSDVPAYFGYVPDRLMRNTEGAASSQRTVSLGAGVNFALMDDCYCGKDRMSELCKEGIPFTAMLPEDDDLYKRVIRNLPGDIREIGTKYKFEGQKYYAVEAERLSDKGYNCYTYAVLLPKKLDKEHSKNIQVIISSNDMDPEGAASIYYIRNREKKFFKTTGEYITKSKGVGKITTEAINGHVMISFLASSLAIMMRKDLEALDIDPTDAFTMLRNQKCKVYRPEIVPSEADGETAAIYKRLGLEPPESVPRQETEEITDGSDKKPMRAYSRQGSSVRRRIPELSRQIHQLQPSLRHR